MFTHILYPNLLRFESFLVPKADKKYYAKLPIDAIHCSKEGPSKSDSDAPFLIFIISFGYYN